MATKYNLNDFVEFEHKGSKFSGEIIGITEGKYAISYCIYNKDYVNHPDVFPMEKTDLESFTMYSKKFEDLIGSYSFWKPENYITNVIISNKKVNGAKCLKCKEFNKYIEVEDYKCWKCTNYPF